MVHRKTKPDSGIGATTKGIALATGISATTVASILSGRNVVRVSEATRDRVLTAAREMGYRRNGLAAALRTGRTNTIGIVSPLAWGGGSAHLRHGYLRDLLVAISVAAARAGMNAMTFLDMPLDPFPPGSVADRRVEGVVLFGITDDLPGARAWVDALYAMGIPCAEIGSRWGPYQVHADNVGGARQATEHLIGLGHRRIAFWRSGTHHVSSETREQGFRAAMRAAGLSEGEMFVFLEATELKDRFQRADRPTALFCHNDSLALYAFDHLRAAGLRVPEDVSLVGFDNDGRIEAMRPRLTTVINPLDGLADAAVALVRAQRAGEEIVLPAPLIETQLVVRESTAPPPAPGNLTKEL